MTDKEKIRAEVERLMNELIQEKEKGFGSDIDDACILELQNVLTFIDSMQEEPVRSNIDFEHDIYKAFGQVKDFTLCMQIAKRFYDMGKNSKDSQELVSDGLEIAADECIEELLPETALDAATPFALEYVVELLHKAFKAGAQWQKEQMIDKAIDWLKSNIGNREWIMEFRKHLED